MYLLTTPNILFVVLVIECVGVLSSKTCAIEKKVNEWFLIILHVIVTPGEMSFYLEEYVHVVHESHMFLIQTSVLRETCCAKIYFASDGHSTFMYVYIQPETYTILYLAYFCLKFVHVHLCKSVYTCTVGVQKHHSMCIYNYINCI